MAAFGESLADFRLPRTDEWKTIYLPPKLAHGRFITLRLRLSITTSGADRPN